MKSMKEVKIRSIIVIKHLIKIINSKIETETTLQTILQTILLIIHQITTKQIILKKKKLSKPKDNEKDSEVENLTEKFSKMKLYVCHRCGKPGHIACHCRNEISPEILKYKHENSFKLIKGSSQSSHKFK